VLRVDFVVEALEPSHGSRPAHVTVLAVALPNPIQNSEIPMQRSMDKPVEPLEMWFAVQTTPRQEGMVSELLRHKGYSEYLPVHEVRRQWKYRTKTLTRVLFPGYLFCQFPPDNRMPILTTPGVIRILGVGKTPLPVDTGELAAIRTICDAGLRCEPVPFLTVGETIRVEEGPLRGVEGIVLSIKKNLRLLVSVTILQRSVAVEIDPGWVSRPDISAAAQRSAAGLI
jgi:transcription antitermination factor NusG